VIHQDIREVTAKRLSNQIAERPAWVVGGPPCQGFSTVGKRKRDDERNFLMHEFHRMVKILEPDGFLIENVLGLKDMSWQGDIAALFEDLGYAVSFHILRAADYGVPQLRRRVVSGPVSFHRWSDFAAASDCQCGSPGPGEGDRHGPCRC
jgi:DNA (cytosine-5)-methyltransferase 1